jgi:hypothetical protein
VVNYVMLADTGGQVDGRECQGKGIGKLKFTPTVHIEFRQYRKEKRAPVATENIAVRRSQLAIGIKIP